MDFKLIFDHLYRTATYADSTTMYAVAMDTAYSVLASYSHIMSRATRTWQHQLRDLLFPYAITLHTPEGSLLAPVLHFSKLFIPFTLVVDALLAAAYLGLRRPVARRTQIGPVILICITGLYGLLAVYSIEDS